MNAEEEEKEQEEEEEERTFVHLCFLLISKTKFAWRLDELATAKHGMQTPCWMCELSSFDSTRVAGAGHTPGNLSDTSVSVYGDRKESRLFDAPDAKNRQRKDMPTSEIAVFV